MGMPNSISIVLVNGLLETILHRRDAIDGSTNLAWTILQLAKRVLESLLDFFLLDFFFKCIIKLIRQFCLTDLGTQHCLEMHVLRQAIGRASGSTRTGRA